MGYINKNQLAEAFGVSLTTIDAWIRKGMPYIEKGGSETGKSWKIDLEAVKRWRENQNYPKMKRCADSYHNDLPLNPATLFQNTVTFSFCEWLSEKLNFDSKKLMRLREEWKRNRPKELIEAEADLNNWLMNGPTGRP